jgi:CRP/FNR family transcriptional regulator, dissimilatory nitrate respiration regulator
MIEIMLELDELWAERARDRRLDAGETLFRSGDAVRQLYRVLEGMIALVRPLPHGADLIVQRARPGDIVAEASLFAKTYHCDAVAKGVARIQGVPVDQVNDLIKRRPDLARVLAAHYAAEVQRVRARAEIASLKTVAMRLDAWLALNEGGLPPRGRWREVAAEIAVSSEALYRELAGRRRAVVK